MGTSYGYAFLDGINPGHIHFRIDRNKSYEYIGGNPFLEISWHEIDISSSDQGETDQNLYKTSSPEFASLSSGKCFLTPEGGLAVKLTNKTGALSVKGEIVTPNTSFNNAVTKIVVDIPVPIGVFYESNILDGQEAFIVVSGIADVYFVGNTVRGHLARGFLTADGGSYVSGQAISEAAPVSPFATDKHFYEIGHVLESRVGAGLAKCILHFN